ncbi:MAG: sulfotransferase [Planctomycetota bacterium]
MWKGLKKRVNRFYRAVSWRQRVLPGLIIIGAQKSGTTSLHSYLCQHPQLVPAYRKEVHFFDGGLDPAIDTWAKGIQWYHSHFPRQQELSNRQIAFEASPLYLFNPLVAERMSSTLPEVKLVAILRNPVERALSQFFYETRIGHESLQVMDAFSAEEKRLEPAWRDRNYKTSEFIHNSYLARGIYYQQISRFLDVFPREQLLILDSGTFFKAPEAGLKQVFRFAGVDSGFPVQDLKAVNVGGNRTEVEQSVYEFLKNFYQPHNERLFDVLGTRFDW